MNTIFDVPDGPMFTIFDFMFSAAVFILFEINIAERENLYNENVDHLDGLIRSTGGRDVAADTNLFKKDKIIECVRAAKIYSLFQTCRYFRRMFDRYSSRNDYSKKIIMCAGENEVYNKENINGDMPLSLYSFEYILDKIGRPSTPLSIYYNIFTIKKEWLFRPPKKFLVEKDDDDEVINKIKFYNLTLWNLDDSEDETKKNIHWKYVIEVFSSKINIWFRKYKYKNIREKENTELNIEIFLNINDNYSSDIVSKDSIFCFKIKITDNKKEIIHLYSTEEVVIHSKRYAKKVIKMAFSEVDKGVLAAGIQCFLRSAEALLSREFVVIPAETRTQALIEVKNLLIN
jgi:hypothetical protein